MANSLPVIVFLGILQAIDTSAADLARKLAVPTNRVTAI
jgi:hypothetical protein